jgi:phosphoserine phosphatase
VAGSSPAMTQGGETLTCRNSAPVCAGADKSIAHAAPPLVVDLDGSLVETDTLIEALLAGAVRPMRMVRAVAAIRHGRARFKQEVAALAALDPALLPYNREVLAFLRDERRRGRELILATGADRLIARGVAQHLGLFDVVLASDGATNLTGARKLASIRQALGGRAFTYLGNDRPDLAVWQGAASAITVNARPRLTRAAARITRIDRAFVSGRARSPAALLILRLAAQMWRPADAGRGRQI